MAAKILKKTGKPIDLSGLKAFDATISLGEPTVTPSTNNATGAE